MSETFPDSFVSAIGRLSLAVRAPAHAVAPGLNLAPRPGASLEFRDYQAYVPGDDLRRIDWAVYGRTRHLFVRRFDRPTAVPVSILVDTSASMRVESPSRFATAARLAAAVAAAALAGHNPLRLILSGGDPARPLGCTGRTGLTGVVAALSAPPPHHDVGLVAAIEAAAATLSRRGVFVVVSDFFDDAGVDAVVDALRPLPHRLVLLRVTQPADADPGLLGDVELQDCERDAALTVSVDAAALQRYRRAYQTYFAKLDTYAGASGITTAAFDASVDTLTQLGRLFPNGVLSL